MVLELRELTEKASTDVPGFTERLMEILPGISEHHCSPGYAGGFIERLHRGTYFAHITEHVAIELSNLAGIGVGYGKTIYGGSEGVYQVAVRFQCEFGMTYLLESAVKLVEAAVSGNKFSVEEIILQAKRIVSRHALGPSTLSIIAAAEARGIPWSRLNDESLIQLGYGKHRKLIEATTTGETSDIAVRIAQDKNFAKKLLGPASLPVPEGIVVTSAEEAVSAFRELATTVAMKPHNGHHGNGVSLNLSSEKEVREAYEVARSFSPTVIIEEFFRGQDYRVLVIGGKMAAAAHRVPAHVIGDGKSRIIDLIEKENKNPLRGEGHEKAMTLIAVDEATKTFLRKNNQDLNFIPLQGTVIYLKETANLSTGGSAQDVTDDIHPDNRELCERAARIIGLDVCGIDLILDDISQSWMEQSGGIIEMNAGPGIRMHLYPSLGKSRDVGRMIIDHMYPANRPSRIPIISITGTNGKTTVSRLIRHIISGLDLVVGNTTTDGIFIDGKQVARGDTTGPASARVVLNDPGVDVAVLETARGGIMKRGLGYDWSDVGIITNIQADHIGQDGIETIEDIVRVKSLVAERVRDGGHIILNADSEPLRQLMAEKNLTDRGRKLILFSREPGSEVVRTHVEKGGRAYVHHAGAIYELHGHRETFIINVKDIPLTIGGTAAFQIENVLAAFAACDVLEVPLRECLDGLRSFQIATNSGRTNLYSVKEGYVLVDYGHNPEAIRSIGMMLENWFISGVTLVLGVPGDRSDAMIGLSGIAAAEKFKKIIIREDNELRGRQPGEVSGILAGVIRGSSPEAETKIIRDSRLALEEAIAEIKKDEVIVYLYEDLEMVKEVLQAHEAKVIHDYARLIPIRTEGVSEVQTWQ
jgi:cyanophycin synthetase